jgi:hypothetical protein
VVQVGEGNNALVVACRMFEEAVDRFVEAVDKFVVVVGRFVVVVGMLCSWGCTFVSMGIMIGNVY